MGSSIYIYDCVEIEKVARLYFKKYNKLITCIECVRYNYEEGEYIIYTDSTQYSIHTKRLA